MNQCLLMPVSYDEVYHRFDELRKITRDFVEDALNKSGIVYDSDRR